MRPGSSVALVSRLVVAVTLAALGASPAHAGETRGPAFGTNRYTASITDTGTERDCDDYVGLLAAGERVSLTLSVPKGSDLRPTLEVLGPDGALRTVTLRAKKAGRVLTVRDFVADTSGDFTVRVQGAAGTQGAYTLSFRTPAAPPRVKARVAPGGEPTTSVAFEAVEGMTADVKVTWARKATPARIVAVLDPQGDDALARAGGQALVTTTSKSASLAALPLGVGHGSYRVVVADAEGQPVAANVSVRLRAPERPHSKAPVALGDEPFLTARSAPIEGVAGRAVRLDGARLLPGVRIYFGARESANVSCASTGSFAEAVVPTGTPGSVVQITAVGADGQAFARSAAFRYVPAARIDAVTDLAGNAVMGWSRLGGLELRLVGDNFRAGQIVRFPGDVDVAAEIVSATELHVQVPVGPPLRQYLLVVDEWGQIGRSPEQFELKTPPSFLAQPFIPAVFAEHVGGTVALRGANFEQTDVLLLDGLPAASVFVDTTLRRFDVAAAAAHSMTVAVRDRLGVVVTAPDFVVKPPATVATVTVVDGAGPDQRGVPLGGGALVRVTGSDFHPADAIGLGGAVVTLLSGDDHGFEFLSPAGSPGDATLRIVDGAGQVTEVEDVARFVGFAAPGDARIDATTAASAATRGAVADLDGDGCDDVVVDATDALARVLLNDGAGVLDDVTSTSLSAALSDRRAAEALVLGDVDGDDDFDLIVAAPPADPQTSSGIRVFGNNGAGGFAPLDALAPSATAHGVVNAVDQYGYQHALFGARTAAGGTTALALGDIDGDGYDDLVVGRDAPETDAVFLDLSAVDLTRDPPFIDYWVAQYSQVNQERAHAATHVHLSSGLSWDGVPDASDTVLPAVTASGPAWVARDVALADIDRDGDADLVLTWDDPTTVTWDGQRGASTVPVLATRVLRNDAGRLVDVTSTWMPNGAGDDYRQADRLALTDVDGDGDADLVLLSSAGLSAWRGTAGGGSASALRVLRNDGSRFVDVGASALPALAGGDDLRGSGLAVRDLDGDGRVDILVATPDARIVGGSHVRSLRVLRQTSTWQFEHGDTYLPAATTDTGEADALLLGDFAGDGAPSLLLLGDSAPWRSPDGARLRVYDWLR